MSVLDVTQAAAALGVTVGTLANLRSAGHGPRWTTEARAGKPGRPRVVYNSDDIAAWMARGRCEACGQKLPHRDRAAAKTMTQP